MRWSWLAMVALACGCRASFVDERANAGGAASATVAPGDLGEGTLTGSGRFVGRAGHVAAGTVEEWTYASVVELRFGADFGVSDVPGPVVVLTARDSIGTAIDPVAGDLEIATLSHPDGAQSYFVAADTLPTPPPANVFVFCKPYGLEVGKAALTAPSP